MTKALKEYLECHVTCRNTFGLQLSTITCIDTNKIVIIFLIRI